MNVLDKFLKYISYDTQSDDNSTTYPSTENQLIFGQILVEECKKIGLNDVYRDNYGYVFATLPSLILIMKFQQSDFLLIWIQALSAQEKT